MPISSIIPPCATPIQANRRIDAALLRDWLGLPATDTTPEPELRELFKLEAPLAVQSTTLPGFFPTNKFSAVPGLIRSVRLASTEADGIGPVADARKRVMVVPQLPRAGTHHRDAAGQLGARDRRARLAKRHLGRYPARAAARWQAKRAW